MLGQGVLVDSTGNQPESVAFIQCVGSRDESLGHLWCSRACCGYALRLAGLIKEMLPQCGISFFYMDLPALRAGLGGGACRHEGAF